MKILVVDDNEDIRDLLRSMLESVGYTVTTAKGGMECLDLILKEKFDVVLLDITMPEFSGFDVVQKLNDSGKLSENNMLLFTAASIPDSEIEKWIKIGVKGCLRKPFDPGAMFEAIQNVSVV